MLNRFPKVIGGQVRVDCGGIELSMSQEPLNVPNARPTAQEMSSARVAKRMHVGFDFSFGSVAFDALLNHHIRESLACLRQP
jgi:hypothetical protein